jgi:transcriptional regulator with XRE-family HTH domain
MKLYDIGSKIRDLRKEKSLTQEQLSKLCGISRVTFGKIERGEVTSVSIHVLDLILANLGYEIEFKSINDFGLTNL